jgi:hypothetical protein
MIDIDEYDFGNTTSLIDNNNEDYYKDYFEEMNVDYWVEEYKNNPNLT